MLNIPQYIEQRESLLTSIEGEIESLVQKSLSLYSSKTTEAGLYELNSSLRDAIAATLFIHQRRIAELALEHHNGKAPPMLSPDQILNELEMAGTPFAEWFKTESPSRWMKDVLKATPAELKHTVRSAISTAAYGMAARQEKFSWASVRQWQWITRPELSSTGTCSECEPLDQRIEDSISGFGVSLPVHPFCKCLVVPVNS